LVGQLQERPTLYIGNARVALPPANALPLNQPKDGTMFNGWRTFPTRSTDSISLTGAETARPGIWYAGPLFFGVRELACSHLRLE
jgi:hypothetical protein